jgi:hypothetical protein
VTAVSWAPQTATIAGILTAAQQDMEFHSRLAVARHHLENLLAGLSATVAAADPDKLAALLRGARLIAEEHDGSRCLMSPDEAIRRLAPDGRHVILTTSNLSLTYKGPDIEYTGTYQRWTTRTGPDCVSLGTFGGTLITGPQVWKWSEHLVRLPLRTACLETC